MEKIDKKDILFVTTTLFTESLNYQKLQLDKFFPESEKILIDGRNDWPKVWFNWIDECLKTDKKWFIHIDEDCFILDDKEILNRIEFMIKNGFGISGCPDGFHEYRFCNHVALNSFFMIVNRDSLIKWKKFHELGIEYPQFNREWLFDYPFEKKTKTTIIEKQGWDKWEPGTEPYYCFMWVLKYMGIKFDYLEPSYNTYVSCTTLLNNTILHSWYVRQIEKNEIVSPLHNFTNKLRYEKIFNLLETDNNLNYKRKYFSIIIPTMWKSNLIEKALNEYQKNKLVKEIIIIDNNPNEKPNLDKFSKIIYYTEGKNLFVNPSWNIGVSLSSHNLIIVNDDIVIHDLNNVLTKILDTDYDIIGIDLKNEKKMGMFIDDLPRVNNDNPLGSNFYGFGCFMYVKNYKYIPNNIKIWYGDDFLVFNNLKRGIIRNSNVEFSTEVTVNHIKNSLGGSIFEYDKNNFKTYKQSNNLTNKKNVLVSLVNFGEEQINYLSEVVKELKSFVKYNVKIIVNSNIPLNIPEIDEVNLITDLKDYQLLPLTCRKTIWENKDNFDIFIYGENDHLFKEHHIDRHIEYTKILPKNRISGLIQYEENENGFFYPGYHAHYEWDYESVEEYDGRKFAHFTNVHQATFILTKEQLHTIGKLHDFTNFFGKSNYSVKCKVNTDVYDFGGMKKMICISEFKENLIHHLPNLYIDGEKGRNKNQRSDNKRMSISLIKLLSNNKSTIINGFYLNLDRRQDRKIKMENELKKTTHNIQRYPAIDGTKLKSLNGFYPSIQNSEFKQYATYLSHLNMIKLAKQNGWNKVIIMEDDLTLCDDFDVRLDFYLNNLPKDWKIAYLGYTETKNTQLTKVSDYIHRVKQVYGCWGMVINSSIYDDFIRISEQKNMVIDWVIFNDILPNYGCYAFLPFLAYVNDDYSDLWNGYRELGVIRKHYKNLLFENKIVDGKKIIDEVKTESNLDKLKKLMNLDVKKKVEIDYNNINNVLSKKDNFYKTNSSIKPLRENIPQNRNEITQLKKDSLTKTSRDLFNKGKKFKG